MDHPVGGRTAFYFQNIHDCKKCTKNVEGGKFPTFYPQSYPHKKGGKQWKEGVIHRVIHIVHKKKCGFL